MGILGWTPSEFWSATPHDLMAALDGWKERHGISDAPPGLDGEGVAKLRAMIEQDGGER